MSQQSILNNGVKIKLKLRDIRIEKKMGLNELARLVNISPSYISELERGLKTNPSKETMRKIAEALEKPVYEVFFE